MKLNLVAVAALFLVAQFVPTTSFGSEISEAENICSSGVNQSPVEIGHPIQAVLEPLSFSTNVHYPLKVVDQALEVTGPGTMFLLREGKFDLKRIELRAPSEHVILGKNLALELQLYHADWNGNLLAVSLLFERGRESGYLQKLIDGLDPTVGFISSLDPYELINHLDGYYRYSGSLTRPPCTEGVIWIVDRTRHTVSDEQLERLSSLLSADANRSPQPLNGRLVLE